MSTIHRIGFHYYPDEEHYTAADLAVWLPQLKALGAAWLILRGSLARLVPEPFIRGLLKAGIEPVVYIAAHPIRRLDPATLRLALAPYARWGVRYVILFTDANLRTAWDPFGWAQPGLVERFVDCLLPALYAMRAAGLVPTLPPLVPGGDYWDTAFLESTLKSLVRRGCDLHDMALGIYLFTGNHPLDCESAQNQAGLCRCRALDAIAQRITGGASLKHIVIAGGATPGAHDLPGLPPIDLTAHAALNLKIVQRLESGDLPTYIQNMAFWLLAAAPESAYAGHAWFTPEGDMLPAAAQLMHKTAYDI